MTDKAYIVANEQQEREVLKQFETKGYVWSGGGEEPNEWVPSHIENLVEFPYVLLGNGVVSWKYMYQLEDEEIVFDGQEEEHMSEKYVVSQKFMNELKGWKHDLILEDAFFVNQEAINNMPKIIKNWWVDDYETIGESNKRLISIIRYMSGANDFEVEKPKKWVVRSKEHDKGGHYQYVIAGDFDMSFNEYHIEHATRFDTKEEAESWANSHQEVVEVEE